MDALILSCGTGGGHNSAGAAVAEELTRRGHRVTVLNPYRLKGEGTADVVDKTYVTIAQKAPSAFGAAYRLANVYRRLPVSSPVRLLNKRMVPVLASYFESHPCDAVVMPHLFPAEILTNMKREGLPTPATYFVATDYTCIPFTEETDCDFYVIPSVKLTEEFLSRGLPKEKLLPLGIPVSRAFREKVGKREAREKLGLDPEKPCILVAGGSIGAGAMEALVPLLLERYGESAEIAVVCGNNKALYRHLEPVCRDRCHLIGYTDQMADYMHACDLFLSKPGGLSSTEAAVSGTALVHLMPIPGCETRNMAFFAENGMSLAVGSLKKELAEACDRLMCREAREEMRRRQEEGLPKDAAVAICEKMEEENEKRRERREKGGA